MRRRRPSSGDAFTLFPFLAVLICTMGSLIVLLVVMVQHAKATATDRRQGENVQRQKAAAEQEEAIWTDVEDLKWRVQVLAASRDKTAEDLRTREAELSYIEDEIRQLRARLDRAADEAGHIERLANQERDEQQASRAQLAELRERLDYARESLTQAREQFKRGERSYALVPYHGPSGTRRRPIYIECRADRVVLQPQGIELFSDDFREPLTEDNALASALRAQREYFADATQDRNEPPYPLIVVRPDGAHAYAAARAAMSSWDGEFGYELVDDQMRLAFPQADTALVDVVREAVEEARARRQLLQSIAPARFGRGQPLLTASNRGGFVPQGGAVSEQAVARATTGSFASESDPTGSDHPGQSPDPGLRPNAGPNGAGDGAEDSTAARAGGDPKPPAPASSSAQHHSVDEHATNRAPGAGTPPPAGKTNEQSGQVTGPTGTSADGKTGPGANGRGAARAGGSIGLPGLADATPGTSPSRGQDWGLPQRALGSTGITRPIRVDCYPDRLVILPEVSSTGRPDEQLVEGSMRDEVDELVSKIWKRMENWGIAGSRMYWKPVLQVQVGKGAEARFAELVELLSDSGIVVERK
jgi:hypothetical protein